jgi:hypothetical protein
MDTVRIQREFAAAQGTFAILELRPTSEGTLYVRVALQAMDQSYVLSIKFPDSYPNELPRIFIDAPAIPTTTPHRYQGGAICFLHPSMWNPGIHNLTFTIGRAAKWLNKYEVWKRTGQWPGKEVKH